MLRRPHPPLFVVLVIAIWALTQVPGNAQELRTTAAGEKIIVYPDGSARYFNDLSPVAADAAAGGAAYQVVSVNIEPLGTALTPTETDLRNIATRRLNLARAALELAGTRARAASENRNRIEMELNAARRAGNLTELNQLQRQLSLARELETEARANEDSALRQVGQVETTIASGSYVEDYNAERRRRNERLAEAAPARREDRQLKLLLPREVDFTGYGPATTRGGIREPLPCRNAKALAASNGAAPRTPLLPFFSFTDASLRGFLDGKEYLTASAYTSRNAAGDDFLHLNLSFSTPTARNAYGTLPAGTSLSIHFLNGRSLTLAGVRESIGIVNHQQQSLVYDVDYPLSRGDQQRLVRDAVDYVRIFWSGGYEEYPVARVDALKEICRCL